MEARGRRESVDVDELIARYRPQLAQLVTRPPSGKRYIHELKLDGYRAGAAVVDGEVRLVSRRGSDYAREFPEIADALRAIAKHDVLFDGEIVVLDERGRTD